MKDTGNGVWFHTAYPDTYRQLREYARSNRNNMTDAERVLWNHIKRNQLRVGFLRQHIIGDYIVDFLSKEDGLIIEVDGAYHSEPQQMLSDEARSLFLHQQGFRVIRFSNDEVLFDIENVLATIKKELV